MEDEERKKRNKFNCANRCDDANSCYHGRCRHCQSFEAIQIENKKCANCKKYETERCPPWPVKGPNHWCTQFKRRK